MSGHQLAKVRKALAKENRKWPDHLIEVPKEQWPAGVANAPRPPIWVMRSNRFLVQCFPVGNGIVRLSIVRASVSKQGWASGISWDDLQVLKFQAGYSECDAVEVYPKDEDMVDVANMRHLFVYIEDGAAPDFIWRKEP